jgi:hypothetical protein
MKKPSTSRPSLLQRFLASDMCDLLVGTAIALALGLVINAASAQPITSPSDKVALAIAPANAAPATAPAHTDDIRGRKSTALPMRPRVEKEFIRREHSKLRPTAGDIGAMAPTF